MYGKSIQKWELLQAELAWHTDSKEKVEPPPTHKYIAYSASCYRSQTLRASLALPAHFCLFFFIRLVPPPGSRDSGCSVGTQFSEGLLAEVWQGTVGRAEGMSCLTHGIVYSQKCWGPWRLEEHVLSDSYIFFYPHLFWFWDSCRYAATPAPLRNLTRTRAMLASNPSLKKC